MKYRTEWKYICEDNDLYLIENKISKLLKLDIHANNETNKYNVCSLYFDDVNNTCLFDNDAGLGNRFKYRIRYYDNNLNNVVLEKKIKNNGLGIKKQCPVKYEELCKIMSGDIFDVFWETKYDLLKKFCIDCVIKQFRPKVIVDYERTAYVDPIHNIRITFDRNISGSKDIDKFIDGKGFTKYPLQEKNKHILEIKFDDVLPSYIKNSLQNKSLKQTTFSKYYLSRTIIERS